jgi:hypothetical protein
MVKGLVVATSQMVILRSGVLLLRIQRFLEVHHQEVVLVGVQVVHVIL